ncbi:MAG TPA: tetratricopeptide repeat protein, partial [Bacteroidota bacterium]|nr:tetratricopeptide repeat protein [Bacteroidota bacterium]
MKPRSFLPILLVLLSFSLAMSQDTKENADFKLAVNLYNDKLYDLALEQFRQFVSTYPNTQQGIEARFYLGLCQTKQSKFDDARLTFQNFALAFPDHPRAPEAWWNVADAYVSLRNFREAASAFERVKTFHPKSKLAPSALVKSAEYFDLAGDPESSRKVLRTLIQDYSASDVILPARLKLAQMYLGDNQFELARAEAKRVSDGAKEPDQTARALVLMARALAGLGRYEEAQRALDDVTQKYVATSSYYDALSYLGSMKRELGYASSAFTSWKQIDADSARAPAQVRQQALIRLGDGHWLRGETTKALQSFEAASRISSPQRGEALYKAGLAAEQGGEFQKAQSCLSRALADTASPVPPADVLIAAARVSEKAENHAEALRLYSTFQSRFPTDQRLAQTLLDAARICQRSLRDYPQALSNYDALISRYPGSALIDEALFGKGEALRL